MIAQSVPYKFLIQPGSLLPSAPREVSVLAISVNYPIGLSHHVVEYPRTGGGSGSSVSGVPLLQVSGKRYVATYNS